VSAVEEAISFLNLQKAIQPMAISENFTKSARDICLNHGFAGLTGSLLRDGTTEHDRLRRHGKIYGSSAECLVYGAYSAFDAVAQALIDDGDSIRSDRLRLFNAGFTVVGAYCAMHEEYGNMVSIVLATDFECGSERRTSPVPSWAAPKPVEPPPAIVQPDQSIHATVQHVPEPVQVVYKAPEPVQVAYQAPEPVQVTYKAPEPVQVAYRAPEPVQVTYKAPEPVQVAYRAPEPVQVTYKAPEPVQVAYRAPEPVQVTYKAPEPVQVAYRAPEPVQVAYKAPEPVQVTYKAPEPVQVAYKAPAPAPAPAPPTRVETITETSDAYVVDLGETGPVTSAQLFKKGLSFVLRTTAEGGSKTATVKMPFPFDVSFVTTQWEGDHLLVRINKVSVNKAPEETIFAMLPVINASATAADTTVQFAQGDNELIADIVAGTIENKVTLKLGREEAARSTVKFDLEFVKMSGMTQESYTRTRVLKLPFITRPDLINYTATPASIRITFAGIDLAAIAADETEHPIPL
jgi:hypothetical protein